MNRKEVSKFLRVSRGFTFYNKSDNQFPRGGSGMEAQFNEQEVIDWVNKCGVGVKIRSLKDKLLLPYEVGKALHKSVKTLSRMRVEGQGPGYFNLTRGTVRYLASDFDIPTTMTKENMRDLRRYKEVCRMVRKGKVGEIEDYLYPLEVGKAEIEFVKYKDGDEDKIKRLFKGCFDITTHVEMAHVNFDMVSEGDYVIRRGNSIALFGKNLSKVWED